jgi:mRNA-degrading endonuclease toxin of MazEF toxin-antitoxin module
MISLDQLRNVLQRTTTASATTTAATPSTMVPMNMTSDEPAHVQTLLDQMRTMGLTDDVANRQALEASNWDLKAALDLLLG